MTATGILVRDRETEGRVALNSVRDEARGRRRTHRRCRGVVSGRRTRIAFRVQVGGRVQSPDPDRSVGIREGEPLQHPDLVTSCSHEASTVLQFPCLFLVATLPLIPFLLHRMIGGFHVRGMVVETDDIIPRLGLEMELRWRLLGGGGGRGGETCESRGGIRGTGAGG